MSLLNNLITKPVRRALERFASNSAMAQAQKIDFLERILGREKYADPCRLSRHEHQIFSQGGEDGVLREIFRRIGTTNKLFVEIGVGDGLENNTAALMYEGWRGLWVEGGSRNCVKIRHNFTSQIDSQQLSLVQGMVTAENAAKLVGGPYAAEIDLLSIDVDRNTYYIWKALNNVRARTVVVEYNALFPADMPWIVDYDSAKWWKGTSYFGASLKSLELLGSSLGYSLVDCDIRGVNAFFVRRDLCGELFCTPFTAENHYEPARYYLHTKVGHPRAFAD